MASPRPMPEPPPVMKMVWPVSFMGRLLERDQINALDEQKLREKKMRRCPSYDTNADRDGAMVEKTAAFRQRRAGSHCWPLWDGKIATGGLALPARSTCRLVRGTTARSINLRPHP